MTTLKPLTLLAGMLLVAATAAAETCQQETTATLETPAGTFYVVNDLCQPDCLFSIWIYQESNGEPGLQRCEEIYDEDDCTCPVESDTILF